MKEPMPRSTILSRIGFYPAIQASYSIRPKNT